MTKKQVAEVVAPHVGAWIEIRRKFLICLSLQVAPHVGAWIEIFRSFLLSSFVKSHPMWVRGLKFINVIPKFNRFKVAPHVGAWMEMIVLSLSSLRAHLIYDQSI